jgi:hypothetical protein
MLKGSHNTSKSKKTVSSNMNKSKDLSLEKRRSAGSSDQQMVIQKQQSIGQKQGNLANIGRKDSAKKVSSSAR